MDAIHKLPFFLGGFMAVIVGMISYVSGSASQTIYVRMAVVMVVFYVVGSFIRKTLSGIKDELDDKEQKRRAEEQLEAEEASMNEAFQNAHQKGQPGEHKVDLVADDFDEDFSPLTISRVITSKLEE